MLYDFDAVKIYKGKKGLIFGKRYPIYNSFLHIGRISWAMLLYYIPVIDDILMNFVHFRCWCRWKWLWLFCVSRWNIIELCERFLEARDG